MRQKRTEKWEEVCLNRIPQSLACPVERKEAGDYGEVLDR